MARNIFYTFFYRAEPRLYIYFCRYFRKRFYQHFHCRSFIFNMPVLELIFSDHDAYCLPPCQFKCPTRVDIPGYLKQNTLGNWEEATRILKRSLPFPAILRAPRP